MKISGCNCEQIETSRLSGQSTSSVMELEQLLKVKLRIVAFRTGDDKEAGTFPFSYLTLTVFCGK